MLANAQVLFRVDIVAKQVPYALIVNLHVAHLDFVRQVLSRTLKSTLERLKNQNTKNPP
jgi:hypothetical protein